MGGAGAPEATDIFNWTTTARDIQQHPRRLQALLDGHTDRIGPASFSPDGTRIVTTSYDKTARVWNADGTGELVELKGHTDVVVSPSFSPHGIVTASADKTARVWNADGTGESVELKGRTGVVWSASFSPDGSRIVTASSDKTARVWNADGTGEGVELKGHTGEVGSASFSPDGTRIVTGHGTTRRGCGAGRRSPRPSNRLLADPVLSQRRNADRAAR